MIRVRILSPLAVVGLTAVAACSVSTELLSKQPSLSFCPTRIDVYGGTNTQLAGCGGPGPTQPVGAAGYFSPGTSDYDATLAGRLQARLVADPDLLPVFGEGWKVRSCSAAMESLPQLVPPLTADSCGKESPPQGNLTGACTADPAPLMLLAADNIDDRCHGGGPDSFRPDDADGYATHFAARLDGLLVARAPRSALVGPRTEWPAPVIPHGGGPDAAACSYQRPAWNVLGLQRWQSLHTAKMTVQVTGDLQEEFKHHHQCCSLLGVSCSTGWYSTGPGIPGAVNCDGAQAITDFWYSRLKAALLSSQFECP